MTIIISIYVKIKRDAEIRAHSVVDEAQEKAMDTVMLIDNIEKEIELFREDLVFLRRDIKIGTLTLDDRLDNIYLRLCKNMDNLRKIKELISHYEEQIILELDKVKNEEKNF